MSWLALFCLMACIVALVFFYWWEISKDTKEYPRARLLSWLRRGLLTPLLIWVLMNIGRMPVMPPLTRRIGYVRGGGAWGKAFLMQIGLAGMVIVCWWALFAFAEFLNGLFKRAKNKDELVIATVLWSPVLFILCGLFYVGLGWPGGGFGVLFWIWPLTHYFLSVGDIKPPLPTYSQAIAKMKFGKYTEAEVAIIAQLERCATDFDGWMMLADLYANQFHDVAEAEKTICDLCEEPTTTLPQISMALHKLADWQLNLRSDPAAAKRVLEEIGRRMPGTHLAVMAQHRINQLPHTVKELDRQHTPKKVLMPAWIEESEVASQTALITTEDAVGSANQLVEQLTRDPNDIAAREKLAKILAGPLANADQAIDQLDLLLNLPGQPAAKTAEWLGLMASWLIERDGPCEKAQNILERLIHEFPQTPQAFAAQRRLSVMRVRPGGKKK